jgi:transcriptional regulator with XRE-family HTH domain
MLPAGKSLRTLREKLGLTMRDIETSSARMAEKYRNEEFSIPPSRLSDIETKGVLPSIFRLYTLAVIYRRDLRELLAWYGVDMNNIAADLSLIAPPRSHVSEALSGLSSVQMPVRMDPGFDQQRTANLGRMVEQWGLVPLSYLAQFAHSEFTYGYIGNQDFTMYPILPPGSFIQVDEEKNKVVEGLWRSEYERPIYFVETRDGHTCCWCSLRRDDVILQPHPLSPVPVRVLRHPQEAEIIGQVVGVAMKLTEWHAFGASPAAKVPPVLN